MKQNVDRFKFRVLDKTTKQMIYDGIDSRNKFPDYPFDLNIKGLNSPFAIDRYIIMQSTGLKDKNGELIYEGDILRTIWNGEQDLLSTSNAIVYSIEYQDNGSCFRVCNDNSGLVCDYDFAECSEIIGNIYETPELLNK